MPKAEETTLEIHLPLLKANVDAIRSRLKPNTLFLAVVKAFAYGSAQTEIALFFGNFRCGLLCCCLRA